MQEIRLFPTDLYILPTILFTNTHILIMKKIYTLIAAALACAGTAVAQQLPNNIGSFDGTWETCYPNAGDEAVGTQPIGWGASNVYQMMPFELVSQKDDRTSSDDNTYSVHMYNRFCGLLGMGATAPAYITLGDAWNYGDGDNLNKPQDKSDGGSYGGIEFTRYPDAISLWVKRTHATSAEDGKVNTEEKATVLVYSWKGETSSTVRVGLDMSLMGKTGKDVTMTNRDKDVLGMITDGVTKSEDFELISKSENYIEGNIADWTQKVFDINYLSESTPEKLNIVIACSDYFNRPNLGVNNTLDVDDVALVYYSTLSKLTIGGSEIALTDDTYEYAGTGEMPTSEGDVVATTKSKFAETKVTLDTENSKVIITVTNQGGADLDGKTSHTYTITYPAATAEPKQYSGYLNISLSGGAMPEESATIEITENGNGTCTFRLPNFNFQGTTLGDIVVENVTMTESEGTTTYQGSVKGLVLVPAADPAPGITADIELNGTIDANGIVDFKIDVMWLEASTPIYVTFTTNSLASVEGIAAATTAVYGTTGAIAINGYTGMAQVYNIGGTLVASRIVDGDATIDVAAGIYIVRIDGTNVKVIVK